MRLWLEQERDTSETLSKPVLSLPHIRCSISQRKRLEKMAQSRTIGIDFIGAMLQKIRAIIGAHPEATRAAPARIACQEFGSHSPTGKVKTPLSPISRSE